MCVYATKDGKNFYTDPEGGAWRVYPFIEDTKCLQSAETPELFAASALAFGRFQQMLKDYPADTLYETIPRFHDTEDRLAKLKAGRGRRRHGPGEGRAGGAGLCHRPGG